MKQIILFFLFALGCHEYISAQSTNMIPIETKRTILLYSVGKDQKLYQSYIGSRLLQPTEYMNMGTKNFESYLTAGTSNLFEPAIRVKHADNNPSLELQYISHKQVKLNENTTLTTIKLKDPQYPFEVVLNFKANYNEDVIEEWTEIKHNEKKPRGTLPTLPHPCFISMQRTIGLPNFMATGLRRCACRRADLTSGIKIIDSKLGTRADMYQTPVFFLSMNAPSG